MKEYTAKQIKELEKNPYVYKVLKCTLFLLLLTGSNNMLNSAKICCNL